MAGGRGIEYPESVAELEWLFGPGDAIALGAQSYDPDRCGGTFDPEAAHLALRTLGHRAEMGKDRRIAPLFARLEERHQRVVRLVFEPRAFPPALRAAFGVGRSNLCVAALAELTAAACRAHEAPWRKAMHAWQRLPRPLRREDADPPPRPATTVREFLARIVGDDGRGHRALVQGAGGELGIMGEALRELNVALAAYDVLRVAREDATARAKEQAAAEAWAFADGDAR